jgi:hypothetical protein
MRQMRWPLAGFLLLSACGLLDGQRVEISTHCGLEMARIDFAGSTWQFAEPKGGANAPPGWGDPSETVTVHVEDETVSAVGPDGSRHELVQAEEGPLIGCI